MTRDHQEQGVHEAKTGTKRNPLRSWRSRLLPVGVGTVGHRCCRCTLACNFRFVCRISVSASSFGHQSAMNLKTVTLRCVPPERSICPLRLPARYEEHERKTVTKSQRGGDVLARRRESRACIAIFILPAATFNKNEFDRNLVVSKDIPDDEWCAIFERAVRGLSVVAAPVFDDSHRNRCCPMRGRDVRAQACHVMVLAVQVSSSTT